MQGGGVGHEEQQRRQGGQRREHLDPATGRRRRSPPGSGSPRPPSPGTRAIRGPGCRTPGTTAAAPPTTPRTARTAGTATGPARGTRRAAAGRRRSGSTPGPTPRLAQERRCRFLSRRQSREQREPDAGWRPARGRTPSSAATSAIGRGSFLEQCRRAPPRVQQVFAAPRSPVPADGAGLVPAERFAQPFPPPGELTVARPGPPAAQSNGTPARSFSRAASGPGRVAATCLGGGDEVVGHRPQPGERAAVARPVGEQAVDLRPGLVGGRARSACRRTTYAGRFPPRRFPFSPRRADRLAEQVRHPPGRAGREPPLLQHRPAPPPASARSAARTPRRSPSARLPARPAPGRGRRPRSSTRRFRSSPAASACWSRARCRGAASPEASRNRAKSRGEVVMVTAHPAAWSRAGISGPWLPGSAPGWPTLAASASGLIPAAGRRPAREQLGVDRHRPGPQAQPADAAHTPRRPPATSRARRRPGGSPAGPPARRDSVPKTSRFPDTVRSTGSRIAPERGEERGEQHQPPARSPSGRPTPACAAASGVPTRFPPGEQDHRRQAGRGRRRQEQRRQPGGVAPDRLVRGAEQHPGVRRDEERRQQPTARTACMTHGRFDPPRRRRHCGRTATRNETNAQAPKTPRPHDPADIGDQHLNIGRPTRQPPARPR